MNYADAINKSGHARLDRQMRKDALEKRLTTLKPIPATPPRYEPKKSSAYPVKKSTTTIHQQTAFGAFVKKLKR